MHGHKSRSHVTSEAKKSQCTVTKVLFTVICNGTMIHEGRYDDFFRRLRSYFVDRIETANLLLATLLASNKLKLTAGVRLWSKRKSTQTDKLLH